MPAERFVAQLNDQIANEFAAHQQYLAAAVYFDRLTMPQLAGFFYHQATVQRGHAMMMIKFLADQDAAVVVPGVEAPTTDFDSVVGPIELVLEQERRVTDQINLLTRIAREEGDFAAEAFVQWFTKQQVDAVITMSDLQTVARRSTNDPEAIEAYIWREQTPRERPQHRPGEDGSAPA